MQKEQRSHEVHPSWGFKVVVTRAGMAVAKVTDKGGREARESLKARVRLGRYSDGSHPGLSQGEAFALRERLQPRLRRRARRRRRA